MAIARRGLLGLGLGALGAGCFAGQAAASELLRSPERTLAFANLHTGETLKATYWEAGAYVSDALSAVSKVLRDFRTGDSHAIDPRLLDLLSTLNGKVGSSAPIQIISGYRSPATNAKLHDRSGEVAKHSLHMEGKAVDIRMQGVQLDHLHKAALSMGMGGVGLYPVSNFVHIDVGRVRSWKGA